MSTHRPGGQHGRVVVDVLDRDDGSGRVGEAKVQVALHVCSLYDDGVLRHFLLKAEKDKKKIARSHLQRLFFSCIAFMATTTECLPERKKSPCWILKYSSAAFSWVTSFI